MLSFGLTSAANPRNWFMFQHRSRAASHLLIFSWAAAPREDAGQNADARRELASSPFADRMGRSRLAVAMRKSSFAIQSSFSRAKMLGRADSS
jgi:hypothetical protein